MNKTDKVIQFQIWNECNNYCSFCTNKEIYNISNDEKIKNLSIIKEKIKKIDNIFNIIGFIGGEFFQGQLKNPIVKKIFFDLCIDVNQMLNSNVLSQFWITATLIDNDQEDLFQFLRLFDDKSKIWICTSYDIEGRFHTPKMLKSWEINMKKIKDLYPQINLNTTSILTGSFIDAYLNNHFNLSQFCKMFSTSWFGKPPIIPINSSLSKKEFNEHILDNFFPIRQRFLDFLMKFHQYESEFDYNRLFSNSFRADELVQPDITNENNLAIMKRNKYADTEYAEIMNSNSYISGKEDVISTYDTTWKDCKHNITYSPYVDSERCFYCDKNMISQL